MLSSSPHSSQTSWVRATALSWRIVFARFTFALLVVLALALILWGRTKPESVEQMRVRTLDAFSSVLDATSRPFEVTSRVLEHLTTWLHMASENVTLREENAALRHWHTTALALSEENRELRALVHHVFEPPSRYLSARVLADLGGLFARNVLVAAGSRDGVRVGMAALTGEGLIGRVSEAGEWTSRLLMITDATSRLPVVVADTGDQAVVAGQNSGEMILLYVNPNVTLQAGMRVLTSGHGGIFPPNLPVGVLTHQVDGVWRVVPLASFERLRHVQIVEFDWHASRSSPEPIQGANKMLKLQVPHLEGSHEATHGAR